MSFTRDECRKILKLSTTLGALRFLCSRRVLERAVRMSPLSLFAVTLVASGFVPSIWSETCQVIQLRVHVKDSQESPIYDVQVRVQTGTGEPLDRTTGTSGTADFDNIPCGAYSITANKQGFAEKTVTADTGKSP